MAKRTIHDIEKVWSRVEGVRKLSDRVIKIGPWGVGMDGLLTWIPLVGGAYSLGAGALLFASGLQAKASPRTLAKMAAYLLFDVAVTEIPVAGSVVDFFFVGHQFAGRTLQKEIEATHWVEANGREAKTSGDHERHLADMRAAGRKRIVYLHD
ncbi:DUF4112 domain-containing protein [Brevundimonas sp. BAL450]|jgi:hypothetical protein|uniref:DUF4112 domain-containing protein n=1 Tax=Brevundimonas abyssalis TAR-001 TaxID=1391729 RepID=A0A8E0TRX5_9CAUL|nr:MULTISPECIES: DUF4112 domain-containing protein [Brevundimonas]MBG7614562.1 DUF4112 domain-containing protein [Brevundimonas sp. BAL450]GAD59725.1 hypothetical protein MBEBAB_1975 [Brevundimonas abyssalis TAR-001]